MLVVDESGQTQPLPMGDYVLEDGTTFEIVDEEGRADNVVLAEAPEEGEQPAATGADMDKEATTQVAKKVIESTVKESHFNEEEMKEINEKFEALNKKIEALESEKAEFAKAKESAKVELEEFKKANAELVGKTDEAIKLIESFAKAPAAKPTERKQGGFKKFLKA
jgi:chromosome segregation ATPase